MTLRKVLASGARLNPPGWMSEMHYGELSAAVSEPDEAMRLLRQIAELTQNYR